MMPFCRKFWEASVFVVPEAATGAPECGSSEIDGFPLVLAILMEHCAPPANHELSKSTIIPNPRLGWHHFSPN